MTTPEDTTTDLPVDQGWENRQVILAALAPRGTARPARRPAGDGPSVPDDPGSEVARTPGALSRMIVALGRGRRALGSRFDRRVPRERRLRTAIITVAVIVVLVVALAGLKRLVATDISPVDPSGPGSPAASSTTSAPDAEASPSPSPAFLSGIVAAVDRCPQDDTYSPALNAFDNDFNTAWRCTRAKNQDGQQIQVDFGRQVTLFQIRVLPGFDARIPDTPDGQDQWLRNRIVTKLEVYFPKELGRDPLTINTGGERDWRGIEGGINPPASVSKLLIRVAETTPPAGYTPDEAANAEAEVSSVAIGEIQFIGTSS